MGVYLLRWGGEFRLTGIPFRLQHDRSYVDDWRGATPSLTDPEQFVEFYYKQFDSDRTQLAALYRDESMLTFEKEPFQGTRNIIEKLQGLPFAKVQHRVDTVDAQPSKEPGGIVVLVTGALMVDDQPQPMSYVQTFSLSPDSGSYYVFNDMFRLVYPAQ